MTAFASRMGLNKRPKITAPNNTLANVCFGAVST